jgi:1-acyl-sn-glycerol-3-phosphate acyltransferase
VFAPWRVAFEKADTMSDEEYGPDEELVLRDIRALLDQLKLDREHTLTMQSKLTDELGVDSLALVELCDQFERTFDVSLPDEVFLWATTPQQWLEAVTAARSGANGHRLDGHADAGTGDVGATPTERLRAGRTRLVSWARTAQEKRRSRVGRTVPAHASAGSLIYSLYAWVLLVPFAMAIWLLAVLPLPLARRRDLGRALAKITCRALHISVQVEGVLPESSNPYVIAANHSSFIDGLVLYVFLDEPVTFVSSTDLEHQILLGRVMRGFGCVFVDRGRAERGAESVEKLVATIRGGRHLLIFPEGSISARPGLRVFRLGAFETAASSNCPIVPVGIIGSREVLRPGSFRPRPGDVRIAIGRPVVATGNEFSDRVMMRDQVRDVIATLCGDEPDASS